MSRLPPPDQFDFSRPVEWTAWKVRFERFRLATKLNKESGEVQVSTLIYTLGKEADKIFQSFDFNDPGQANNYTAWYKN